MEILTSGIFSAIWSLITPDLLNVCFELCSFQNKTSTFSYLYVIYFYEKRIEVKGYFLVLEYTRKIYNVCLFYCVFIFIFRYIITNNQGQTNRK